MVFPKKAMPQHIIHHEKGSHSKMTAMSSKTHSLNKVRLKNWIIKVILHLSQSPRRPTEQPYCSQMPLQSIILKSEI